MADIIYPIPPTVVIYQTQKNADMTEGRGPMLTDLAFTTLEVANKFIDAQPGCMGIRKQWSKEKYGDWRVQAVPVFDRFPTKNEVIKAQALSKLTEEERKALGV